MISSKLQKPEIEPEDMEQQDKLKRRRKNELKRLKRRHIQTCYKVKNVPVIGRISSKESINNEEKRDHLNLVKETILSCTDKLSLVNVVGLQGALLSNFCSPMYFTSITIGKDKSIKHDLNRNDDRLLPYFFRNLMILL